MGRKKPNRSNKTNKNTNWKREYNRHEDTDKFFDKRQHDEQVHRDLNPHLHRKTVKLTPRTPNQHAYIDSVMSPDIFITFGIGPAGTGKTMIAAQIAVKLLQEGKIDKIVITRPAVSVDEQHGFLPGGLNQKMQPWLMPILDVFGEYYSQKEISKMMTECIIDVSPMAFMRGRTMKRALIIADEMQNATPNQMKMLLTRIGEDSRMIVTGDIKQHDRGFDQNGLVDFMKRLHGHDAPGIRICEFHNKDIQRHAVIGTVLKLYGEE